MTTLNQLFYNLNKQIIHQGLCTHCGTCAGLSKNTIVMKETVNGPLPFCKKNKDTFLPSYILDVCPGRGLNYPEMNSFIFKHNKA